MKQCAVLFIGQHIGYYMDNKSEGVLFMYSIRYVRGHIEVYGIDGTFWFSADSMREVEDQLEE